MQEPDCGPAALDSLVELTNTHTDYLPLGGARGKTLLRKCPDLLSVVALRQVTPKPADCGERRRGAK